MTLKPRAFTALALTLMSSAAQADWQTTTFEETYGHQAPHVCNLIAEQEGATGHGETRSLGDFQYECRYFVPARETIWVNAIPLLNQAQARSVCRTLANQRDGMWTGDWQGNGAFSAGRCAIRVVME